MTLDEAIEHAREVSSQKCAECKKEHEQLANWLEELRQLKNVIGDTYDINKLKKLVEADKDGRCIVLPCKTVFVPTWDAGPNCDGNCPIGFYDEEPCNKCSRGKLFIYELPCKQEHILLLNKTVFATCEDAKIAIGEINK